MSYMVKKISNENQIRTSVHLPRAFKDALAVIHAEEGVKHSTQIKLGLKLYFEKYRKVLKDKGVDVWN